MKRTMASHEDVLLAESEHYAVRSCYEVAVLIDKITGTKHQADV